MLRLLAAYSYFLLGGVFSACLGLGIALAPGDLGDAAAHPGQVLQGAWQAFTQVWGHSGDPGMRFVLPAGAAAVIAAWALRGPFLRAARAGRRDRLYDCAVMGAMLAHAAYGMLQALGAFLFDGGASLPGFLEAALTFAVMSALFGLPTNALLGIAFAEILLWRTRRHAAASAAQRV